MKKLGFIIFLCVILWECKQSNKPQIGIDMVKNPASASAELENKAKENMPVIQFETVTHDFGRVLKGERLSYTFKFTNTGKSNLIITNVESSCSCTTSSPPQAPIRPGESEGITVAFDSRTQEGQVHKMVAIAANTYPVHTVLNITAEVVNP